jgi:hypothetical protein
LISLTKNDTKVLLSALFTNDDAKVKHIVDAYFEASYKAEIDIQLNAVFESLSKHDSEVQYG